MSGAGVTPLAGCDPAAAAELLRALAHPMRLRILCRLLDGELAVSGFESELGLKQPSLSQQLGLLREAGLVITRRQAKSVFYRLADDRVRRVLEALREAFVGDPSTSNRRAARRAAPPARIARSSASAAPRAAASAECGVFSAAGWSADRRR